MTDKEFDELMQHNPHARIVTADKTLVTLAEYKQAQAQPTRTPAQVVAAIEPTEEEMQIAVIRWADSQNHPALKWLMHTPNGGHRDPATAGRLKAAGVRRGVPDLLLPVCNGEWRGLAIEMKRHPNKPTPEQLDWLSHLTTETWDVHVCYSAQAAIDVLREYLHLD